MVGLFPDRTHTSLVFPSPLSTPMETRVRSEKLGYSFIDLPPYPKALIKFFPGVPGFHVAVVAQSLKLWEL